MRNFQAAAGHVQGRRNLVRFLVVASCLSSQLYANRVYAEQPEGGGTSQPSVGITFKDGKVELPPPAPLPVALPAALPALSELPSSPVPAAPASAPAAKPLETLSTGLLPPPPLPASLTEAKLDASPAPAAESISLPSPKKAPTSSSGKVTVKLGDTMPAAPASTDSGAGTANNRTGGMKFSLDDNGVIEHSNTSKAAPATLQQRPAELAKTSRSSSAKVVALPPTKDPSLGADSIEMSSTKDLSGPSIVMAPAPTSPQFALSGQQFSNMAGPAVNNGRAGVPAPGGQIALPTDRSRSAPYAASVTRVVSDESQSRVFEVDVLGTSNLVMPAKIASASARNTEICNVFFNGTALTIVGGMPGETTIEVIMSNGQRRMLAFKVVATGDQQSGPSKQLGRVMNMISQHFPSANISFSQDSAGSITLYGAAASEGDARKILELVRKVCLVPVEDKIHVER